jgi:hypothetical protein
MKCFRFIVIAFFAVFHLVSAYAADLSSPSEKPAEVVVRLYRTFGWECFLKTHSDNDILINQPKTVLERYFVQKLSNMIVRDRAFERKAKELGHIDFVLLFGSQDPDGISNLRITKTPGTNTVVVIYDQNGQRDLMEMRFDTVKTNAGWRISDIHYKLRKSDITSELTFSLRELLSRPYE